MNATRQTLIVAAIALALFLLLLNRCSQERSASAEARLNRNVAGAAVESGQDAVQTAGTVAAHEAASDETGRINDAEIRNAPGADQAVPAAVDAAARSSLCRRAAYRLDPACLREPNP